MNEAGDKVSSYTKIEMKITIVATAFLLPCLKDSN
jgi:hypothetical protein